MLIYILYICVPVGVFLLITLLQSLMDAAYNPYIRINNDNLTVFLYQKDRYSGKFLEYYFVNKNGKWKYKIDSKEIVVYIVLYAILVAIAFGFWGGDEVFLGSLIVITEGFISYIFAMPIHAYFVMKKELKKIDENTD